MYYILLMIITHTFIIMMMNMTIIPQFVAHPIMIMIIILMTMMINLPVRCPPKCTTTSRLHLVRGSSWIQAEEHDPPGHHAYS